MQRSKVFHGWILVAVTLVVGAFSTGAGTWAVSLFVLPMTQEMGWTRSAFYGALTVRTVVSGVISPFIGPMQDTPGGARKLMFITALGLSGGLILLKWVDNLPMFYVLFGGVGTLLAVGGSEMLLSAVLPKWFVRQRARALAIASSGAGAGPLIFPIWVSAVIEAWGWRNGWLALGVAGLLILFPLSFFVHTRPEDIGLHPDGDSGEGAAASGPAGARRPAAERSFTRDEAVKERSFWLLNISGALFVAGLTGLQTNWLVYFQDIGFTPSTAALSATAFGVGSFSARFLWGSFAGKASVRKLMTLATVLTAASVLLLFPVNSPWMMLTAALLNGLALGGNLVMRPLIIANYFGRNHLGAINGVIRPFTVAGGAVGPLLVAGLYELSRSWYLAFGLVIVIWATSAVAVAIAAPPKVREAAPAPAVG